MTDRALMVTGTNAVATAAEIRANVNLIQEVMRAVMQDGVHYGTIPGTQKPSLYKPGSEKILSTFRIAIAPEVTDLSGADLVRFRVVCHATHQVTGTFLGTGIGECSSEEEKYQWRRPVCDEEWNEAPEDRRRAKWQKGRDGPYQVKQIRTNLADVANTILKMAKKRAQIDVTLTVTAASDIFTQDLEDLTPELQQQIADEHGAAAAKPPIAPPQRKPEAAAVAPPPQAPVTPPALPAPNGGPVISEAQRKRYFAMAMKAGWQKDDLRSWLRAAHGFERDEFITRDKYEAICAAVQKGPMAPDNAPGAGPEPPLEEPDWLRP